jgi:hypothetical protein
MTTFFHNHLSQALQNEKFPILCFFGLLLILVEGRNSSLFRLDPLRDWAGLVGASAMHEGDLHTYLRVLERVITCPGTIPEMI